MSGADDRIDLYPQLASWWRHAESVWREHSSGRLSLVEQLDYRRKFSEQFPAAPQRVVYAASGMHLAAARVDDPLAVVEHGLYWAAVNSDEEALYLCALLNSPRITELVRPLMAYGKDERHIDKYVWQLPIPLFDPAVGQHQELATLGREAELLVAGYELDESRHFPALRRDIRALLDQSPIGSRIDAVAEEVLNTPG